MYPTSDGILLVYSASRVQPGLLMCFCHKWSGKQTFSCTYTRAAGFFFTSVGSWALRCLFILPGMPSMLRPQKRH